MKVEDVRNPQLALEYANRAVEKAGSPNPVYMRAPAWAYSRLGNRAKAIRTLEQARNSLLP